MINYILQNTSEEGLKDIITLINNRKRELIKSIFTYEESELIEITKIFESLKQHHKSNQDENITNSLFVFELYVSLFYQLSDFYRLLENSLFEESWIKLQDCIDTAKLFGRFVDIKDRIEVTDILNLLLQYEKIYPYRIFASTESVILKSYCSICGESIQALSCDHIQGNLYWGELAIEIITDWELLAISIVTNPMDKRCVQIDLSDDKNLSFIDLIEFLKLKLPIEVLFELESEMQIKKKTDDYKRNFDETCDCGSGLKIYKCCDKEHFYIHKEYKVNHTGFIDFKLIY